jgi:MFS family permease
LGVAGQIAPHIGWEPWRLTFVIVGVPGLLLALAFLLFVKEPARADQNDNPLDDVSFLGFLKYLLGHYRFYLPLTLAQAALAFFAFALLSWAPTLLIRAHGFQPAAASIVFGLVITPSSLAAIYFWPWLAMRVERKHLHQGVPAGLLAAALLALPSFILAPLMTNKYLFIGGVCLSVIASAAAGVLPNLGFQIFAPRRMRGRASALFSLIGNLVGYGLGPVLTVYFGQLWKGPATLAGWHIAANPLARGLAIDGMIAAPIMVVCTAICLRTARRLPAVEPAETPEHSNAGAISISAAGG